MRFSLFALAGLAAGALAAPHAPLANSADGLVRAHKRDLVARTSPPPCTGNCQTQVDAAVAISVTLIADLHSCIDANDIALAVVKLKALLDIRAVIKAYVAVTVGAVQQTCNDAIVDIDVVVELCIDLCLSVVAELEASLAATVLAEVKVVIKLIADIKAVLKLWVAVGGSIGSKCNQALIDLDVKLKVCLQAYINVCKAAAAAGVVAIIKVHIAILTALKGLCVGGLVSLLVEIVATITICVTATLGL